VAATVVALPVVQAAVNPAAAAFQQDIILDQVRVDKVLAEAPVMADQIIQVVVVEAPVQ
jgi:hypothetical protein